MEVLRISDSKLKIMLDCADMKRYELAGGDIDYNNAEIRRSFFRIMDDIKESHGFDAEGDKLLIQYYPSRDGGCELFVTKLGLLPAGTERAISKSNRVTLLRARRALYCFENVEYLIRASRAIASLDVKSSDVYYDECGDYYLEILERGGDSGSGAMEFAPLYEYASSVRQSLFPYISEHCKKLTDGDAIKRFAGLASEQ